ncbi:hypothetical protein TSUD_60430 [Trifolium subterraneum]|uniref:Uncharacterized protein n=1 Tax=Trifolium subterraneum TaxID=3900 RepID=A0A2Z6N779_TRISU|nr:hypothetical protein TSUD_60430 [Trifolium subterraneum]
MEDINVIGVENAILINGSSMKVDETLSDCVANKENDDDHISKDLTLEVVMEEITNLKYLLYEMMKKQDYYFKVNGQQRFNEDLTPIGAKRNSSIGGFAKKDMVDEVADVVASRESEATRFDLQCLIPPRVITLAAERITCIQVDQQQFTDRQAVWCLPPSFVATFLHHLMVDPNYSKVFHNKDFGFHKYKIVEARGIPNTGNSDSSGVWMLHWLDMEQYFNPDFLVGTVDEGKRGSNDYGRKHIAWRS